MSTQSVLITNGVIITMNKNYKIVKGDIYIEKGKIKEIAPKITNKKAAEVFNAEGNFVIPGLIQTHTFISQTLFRGLAEDKSIFDWLEQKIWPLEAIQTAESVTASTKLGLYELQRSGVTTVLDFGSVNHMDSLFSVVEKSGIRYWGGKCMMDRDGYCGPLQQKTKNIINETVELIRKWHKSTPLIQYAITPRFCLSSSHSLLEMASNLAREHSLLKQVIVSESKDVIALNQRVLKSDSIKFLKDTGFLTENTVVVHGVHLKVNEIRTLINARAKLAHCPSTALKLGSGTAPIALMLKNGLKVGLGVGGAPSNNLTDPFTEMRLASILQKPLYGTTTMPAKLAFYLATLGGAEVLGEERSIGSLEVGKNADLCIINRKHTKACTVPDPYTTLVHSTSENDVLHVMTDGTWTVRDRTHQVFSEKKLIEEAQKQRLALTKSLKAA